MAIIIIIRFHILLLLVKNPPFSPNSQHYKQKRDKIIMIIVAKCPQIGNRTLYFECGTISVLKIFRTNSIQIIWPYDLNLIPCMIHRKNAQLTNGRVHGKITKERSKKAQFVAFCHFALINKPINKFQIPID